MLLKLWERFRGCDHWISTEAIIESSQMEDHVFTYRGGRAPAQTCHQYGSRDRLVWVDMQGNRHTGDCEIPDHSPLYQLIEHEKVAIRYNPDNPDEYYFPELTKAQLHHNLAQVGISVLFVAVVLSLWLAFTHVFN